MPKENRVKRGFMILEDTDALIDQLARLTYRGKQHIIDLAVSELAAKVLSTPNAQSVADIDRSVSEYVKKYSDDVVINEV